jgi:8-oxo-dGTP pyrophosphatase MutT (NUDIX family)
MMFSPPALDALSAPVRDFAERANRRLSQAPPDKLDAAVSLAELASQYGDHRMASDIATALADKPFRAAAVLVPVVAREVPAFLLTERSSDLSSHSGQIAFPGGRIDEGDADPAAAAVRESEEEIGLRPEFVSLLGYLDPYLSGTGFRIVPVVALVAPGFKLALNPREVTDVFEVPLDFLMSPDNHARHSREWKGIARSYYAMPYGERYIWGVTAGIIRRLYERLYA